MKRAIVALALTGAVAGATIAPAQPAPPDTEPHLLLVPDTPEGTAALARTDARTVARYESFSLVEAAGEDVRRLRSAGADRRDDMRTVATAAGAIDPTVDRASLAAKDAPDRERTLALVQFTGPPKDAWLERLAHRRPAGRLPAGERLPRPRARGRRRPARRPRRHAGGARREHRHRGRQALRRARARRGLFAVTAVEGDHGDSTAPAGDGRRAANEYLDALAPPRPRPWRPTRGVVAIQAHTEPELHDERGAQIVAGDLDARPARVPRLAARRGFTGDTADFAIDVTDGGLDDGADPTAHPTSRARLAYRAQLHGGRRRARLHRSRDERRVDRRRPRRAARRSRTTAASTTASASRRSRKLGVSKHFDCTGTRLRPSTSPPRRERATRPARGSRTTPGASRRRRLHRRPPALRPDGARRQPGPAGNQPMVEVLVGGQRRPATATPRSGPGHREERHHRRSRGERAGERDRWLRRADAGADSARDIIDFSSRGPTDDGRLKPDLVAPGTHVTGAAPQHAGYTDRECATSSSPGPPVLARRRHLAGRAARGRRRRARAQLAPARPRHRAPPPPSPRRCWSTRRPTSAAATTARAPRSPPDRTTTRAGAA